MKIKKLNISKDHIVTAVKVGAFIISAVAGVAAGWVGEQQMKAEVTKQVSDQMSKQIKSLPQ